MKGPLGGVNSEDWNAPEGVEASPVFSHVSAPLSKTIPQKWF